MTAESMMRGAREANEESHSAAMGRALGEMSAFIVAINDLRKRVKALEETVQALDAAMRKVTS